MIELVWIVAEGRACGIFSAFSFFLVRLRLLIHRILAVAVGADAVGDDVPIARRCRCRAVAAAGEHARKGICALMPVPPAVLLTPARLFRGGDPIRAVVAAIAVVPVISVVAVGIVRRLRTAIADRRIGWNQLDQHHVVGAQLRIFIHLPKHSAVESLLLFYPVDRVLRILGIRHHRIRIVELLVGLLARAVALSQYALQD